MTVPEDLMYARSHEWIRAEGDGVIVGITHYAQDQLGEVVYVELPEVGTGVDAGDELGTLESVKVSPSSWRRLPARSPRSTSDSKTSRTWSTKIPMATAGWSS